MLPLSTTNPFYPHTNITVNTNSRTAPHFDQSDVHGCTSSNFGFFDGGELVLTELGLIIKLRPTELIFFLSAKLFHLNLDYIGIRGSMVMHTERDGESKWASIKRTVVEGVVTEDHNFNHWGSCIMK